MHIGLHDNDQAQADLISQVLHDYICTRIPTGRALLDHLHHNACDLLIMDLQAPGMDCLDMLRAIREQLASNFPILLITHRTDEDRIVAALDAGATDYIVKPIRRGELWTRVRVLLTRAYPEQRANETLQFGAYRFELPSGRVTNGDVSVTLTQKEFELALLFFQHLGRPLSRAFILESIWAHDSDVPSRTMDTHVSRVRNKLGLLPQNGFRLVPVYSYGYRLEQLS